MFRQQVTLLVISTILSVSIVRGAEQASTTLDADGIAKAMALVPATDPAPTNVPAIADSMKGVHPRLLFTAAEIDALKKQIDSDPILKKSYDDLESWAKKFKASPNIKDVVTGDTPALAGSAGRTVALAYAYALDHDPVEKQGIIDVINIMLNEPYWSTGKELDCSMGAACNMFMVAVLYDVVYNDIDADLRAKIDKALLFHARNLYYLGFKQLCPGVVKYWQQDPQPNHRWYRGRGMASSLLVIADEKDVDSGYLLQEMKKERDFLMKWYPPDGDCHEGAGYQQFGFRTLLDTAMMYDHVLGTKYLDQPGFKNAWTQQLYYWVPARVSHISFGDDQNSPGPFSYDQAPFFIGPHLTRDKNAQAALLRWFQKSCVAVDPTKPAPPYPWTLLAYYDPSVGTGDYKALPTYHLFSDMGAASMRDSWEDNAAILTFKCGPYGGFKLNEYRHAVLDDKGEPHYLNLAHDDPDANSIAMAVGDEFIFHPGVYSTKKKTETISSITVDGKGQLMEGDSFTQPAPNFDMRTLSYLTGWKADDKGRIIIEGEAGNAYRTYDVPPDKKPAPNTTPAPDAPPPEKVISNSTLKKFRRTTIWMPGEYVLVLDDVVADGPHTITWRGTVPHAEFDNPKEGRCHIVTKEGKQIGMQILANKDFTGAIDDMFLAGRWGNELIQQFQFSINSDAVKFACIIDPWGKKPDMTLSEKDGVVTLDVHTGKEDDKWTWQSSADAHTPSHIKGKRGSHVLMELTDKDKAPID